MRVFEVSGTSCFDLHDSGKINYPGKISDSSLICVLNYKNTIISKYVNGEFPEHFPKLWDISKSSIIDLFQYFPGLLEPVRYDILKFFLREEGFLF